MNNDLRQQIAYKLYKIHKLGRVGADFDDKEANELITLIRTVTLDELDLSIENLSEFYVPMTPKNEKALWKSDVNKAIDNLRGTE